MQGGIELERPLGVFLISSFYIIGIAFLIYSVIFFNADANEIGLADRFGLSNFPERLFRIILAAFTLVMVSGYMYLERWGYWMMVLYSFGFGLISYILFLSNNQPLFLMNFISSLVVLTYTIFVRKVFFQVDKDG